jgi:Flp pilus assembly protein TadG
VPRDRASRRGHPGERGSVLALLPAAVLVFLVLGALAVDFAHAWSAERQMANAAAAAANDVASRAIDLDLLYETGELRLRPDRAASIAADSLARQGVDRLSAVVTSVEVDGGTVVVTVAGWSPYLFAAAVPGGPDGVAVEATARATAVAGP